MLLFGGIGDVVVDKLFLEDGGVLFEEVTGNSDCFGTVVEYCRDNDGLTIQDSAKSLASILACGFFEYLGYMPFYVTIFEPSG